MTVTQDDLTWMFKDPEWKNKFLVGSLLALATTFVPLLGLAALAIVYGYALILMRGVIHGEPRQLPRWENFGALFVDGLKAALSALGYVLPGLVIMVCAYLAMFTSSFILPFTMTFSRDARTAFGSFFGISVNLRRFRTLSTRHFAAWKGLS
jgi:hypothetical protein